MVLGTVVMAGPLAAEILPGRAAQGSELPKAAAAAKGDARGEAKAETRKDKPDTGRPDTNKSDTESNKTDKSDKEPGREPKSEARPDAARAEPGAASHADESGEGGRQLGAAGHGECRWIGERIVGLLWKDDLDTAFRHLELYDRFGCPGEHLQLSFRCITRQDEALRKIREQKEQSEQKEQPKETKEQREQNLFDKAVGECWSDPATPAPPLPAAAVEKPAPK